MDKILPTLPNISVIVPCHNHAKYIIQCIKSIVIQDYPNKTICIIDDGSTDNSFEIAKKLLTNITQEQDNLVGGHIGQTPVIIIRNEEAGGPSKARNIGIKAVSQISHFIAPLDADDYYLPEKLSKSMAVMLTDPLRIGLVYSDVLIYNEEKKTWTYEYRRPYDRNILERENIISNAPLISRLALEKVGYYEEDLRTSEDWDLWLRVTESFVALHIPEPLQVYRVTGENATNIVNREQWEKDWKMVYYRLQQRKGNV